MPFNEKDPFHQAAWWFTALCCEACGGYLDHEQSEHPVGSDDFFVEYAQRAKQDGWFVAPRGERSADWQILCPVCAAKYSPNSPPSARARGRP